MARAALTATAIGIPDDVLENASLLTSELVTNSVQHASSEWIEVAITLTADRLRVAVSDQDTEPIRPRRSDEDGGWGLTLVAELATRWGSERNRDGKTIWIEFDLDDPATP
jgi:anti-sigma regulatory factor (Ser/Thr protein kinase)